ncbi:hypothetical protein BDV25DRAFT_115551, partial [Aspergillus avenaceus]
MDVAEAQNKIRSRRSHQKSRLGCSNCKKRRVKCDEKKPSCTKCLNHSIPCDFSTPASQSPSSTPSTRPRYRFKKSKYQSLTSPSPSAGDLRPDQSSVATQCDLAGNKFNGGISFADLQLFHHYLLSTYRTLADESNDKHGIWPIHLPQWGMSFPSILHLILALAALHQAHEKPDLRVQYVAQADDHFTFGVQSVTTVLSRIDSDNCQLVYMSAVLICLVYFGHGPRPGEYLVFSDAGSAEWLVLMRGVRSILVSRHSEIFSGILKPEPDESIEGVSPDLQDELCQHQARIVALQASVESLPPSAEKDSYLHAIRTLPGTFEELYTMRSAGKGGTALLPMVIGWIYRMPESFIVLLEHKDPYALMILAHWVIVLKYMNSSWMFIGWDKHVISGIRASLATELHEWIEWPLNVIHDKNQY